MAISECAV